MPGGKPGDHPLSDLEVHGLELCGRDADEEIRRLLEKFPAAREEVRLFLESSDFQNAREKITQAQRSVSSKILDIWNRHMREHLADLEK